MLNRIECHGELHMLGGDGTVYFSDFREIEDALLDSYRGRARVVYLDPPFGTGNSFEYRRGKKQAAYADRLPREEYMALMREAAALSRELLKDDGTFFLHLDSRYSAHCRIMLDEVFGPEAFTNEIIWAYRSGGRATNAFSRKHDTILMYRKTPEAYFNISAVGVKRGPERRNHMKRSVDEDGRVYYSIRTGGKEYRYYEDDAIYPSDVWDDIEHLHQRDPERTGFVTQKPSALIKRILLACSEEGDLVIDLFCGSGTTPACAAELGRRFAAVDSGKAAASVTRRRLIERSLKMKLYDAVSPLSVEYEGEQGESKRPEDYFDIEQRGERMLLTLKKLPPEACPFYAARGTAREGVFTASDYFLRIKAGESMSLLPGECLHLVDEDFEQGFFAYE